MKDHEEQTLLEVRGLRVEFSGEEGSVGAVDGVSFELRRGEILGLVGESGCGKSATALAILRLLGSAGAITGGEVILEGRDLLRLGEEEMRRVRGRHIAMVFQEPTTSLNPVFTVGSQIVEAVRAHESVTRREARERAVELLRRVRLPSPERRIDDYPHQLSGGMKQRAMIAMALACRPALLIADEPTTALDVTTESGIIDLLREIRDALGTAVILITHDLSLVSRIADRVAVMYSAKIVESGAAGEILGAPLHPYTRMLVESAPRLGARGRERRFVAGGHVPDPLAPPPGCRFHPRCGFVADRCREEEPALREVRAGRLAACHRVEEIEAALRGRAEERPADGRDDDVAGRGRP